MMLAERRGNANDNHVHPLNLAVVGGCAKAVSLSRLNVGAWNSHNVRAAAVKRIHFISIDVKTGDSKPLAAEQ
jgi:hypothetical protein